MSTAEVFSSLWGAVVIVSHHFTTIHFFMFTFLQVTKEEGLALAREFSCPFFETSAAYRYYIDDVFHALVREIRRKEKEAVLAMEKKSKPKNSVWRRLKSPFRKKKDSVT